MQNARLDEAQAGIKIARRNINNLRYMTSLVAQMVKHLPTMQETRVWSLSQEDPLEKEMATDSRTLAWKISWMEEPCRLQSMGLQRVRQDWATSLLLFSDMLMTLPLMVESEVTQLCLTLCDSMDCSLPGSSGHGIFQARVLEWVAISFSRGSSWLRDQTQVSGTVGKVSYKSLYYFWLCWTACVIFVPWPGITLLSMKVWIWIPNLWTARKFR